jgi:hypothetical protein
MRAKRTRTQTAPAPTPDDEHPPDATGQTIDWIGVQATGSGGQSIIPVWIVGGLAALRALPFIAWRVSRRLAARRRSRRS